MCVEAQHRLAFERVHGHGKFTFAAKHPTALKKKCRGRQVWDPDDGAWFGDVLDTIKYSAGVPTTKVPNDISLPLDSYDIHIPAGPLGGELRPIDLAWMIYKHGPVLGALLLDDDYSRSNNDSSYVYPGVLRHVLKGDKTWDGYDGHGVVCFEYKFEGGDMVLHVMDNHEEDGPLKWIKFSAFHEFVRLHVKPIDPKLLRRNSKWRRSDLFDPFEYIANKLYYLR